MIYLHTRKAEKNSTELMRTLSEHDGFGLARRPPCVRREDDRGGCLVAPLLVMTSGANSRACFGRRWRQTFPWQSTSARSPDADQAMIDAAAHKCSGPGCTGAAVPRGSSACLMITAPDQFTPQTSAKLISGVENCVFWVPPYRLVGVPSR